MKKVILTIGLGVMMLAQLGGASIVSAAAAASTALPECTGSTATNNVLIDTSLAKMPTTGNISSNEFRIAILDTIQLIMQMAYVLLTPILMFIGWLLSPDLIINTIDNDSSVLKSFWVILRNITNYIFLILMVFGGAWMVFGPQANEKAGIIAIKKLLPKVIVATVLINFSLVIFKLLIDFAAISTTVVFSMPNTIIHNDNNAAKQIVIRSIKKDGNGKNKCVETKYLLFKNYTCDMNIVQDDKKKFKDICYPTATKNGKALTDSEQSSGIANDKSVAIKTFNDLTIGSRNIPFILAYNSLNITKLENYSRNTMSDFINFFIQQGISVIFLLLTFLIFIALALALGIRIITLFIIIVFSPLIIASSILGIDMDESKYTDPKEILGLIMIPVFAAFPLSLGFMLSYALKDAIVNNSAELNNFTAQIGGIEVTFPNIQIAHISSLGDLFIYFAVLIFIWLAFFAIMKMSKITASITSGIGKFGQAMGRLAQSSWEVIPTPFALNGTKQTLGSLVHIPTYATNRIQRNIEHRRHNPFAPSNQTQTQINTKATTSLASNNFRPSDITSIITNSPNTSTAGVITSFGRNSKNYTNITNSPDQALAMAAILSTNNPQQILKLANGLKVKGGKFVGLNKNESSALFKKLKNQGLLSVSNISDFNNKTLTINSNNRLDPK